MFFVGFDEGFSLSGCDKGCKGLVSPTVTRGDEFSETWGNPTGDRR